MQEMSCGNQQPPVREVTRDFMENQWTCYYINSSNQKEGDLKCNVLLFTLKWLFFIISLQIYYDVEDFELVCTAQLECLHKCHKPQSPIYTCPITNNMLKNIRTLVLCAFEVLNCRREPKGNGPNYWGLHMASILFLLTSSVGFNYSKLWR